MKKLLLILLCLPALLVSQNLPTIINRHVYFDPEDYKYIDRGEERGKDKQNMKKDEIDIEHEDFDDWEGDYPQEPSSVRDVYASSTLIDKRGRYNYEVSNISDDDLRTTWVEGESDYGIGEYIEFEFNSYAGIMIYDDGAVEKRIAIE